ncbi:hypothetical protein AAFF_G00096520 [Aldrovandia affinis]|uniref:Poly [ADP-ribose] polymerase n=1 Tax=Aldrovandia affinis TaxID=143900 RepID=A0AAD7WBH9_9TELE|nr:hypothetical protein AAFF_G00096520 [Aldrovandia affinis]
MASRLSFSEEDLSCSVCCDIFRDPVVLQCSHSFCKSCLQDYWTQKRSGRDCPLCRSESTTDEPVVSLILKNLCDAYVHDSSARGAAEGEEIGELCSLHGEKLKLFCLEDGQPICVVCHTSRKHKYHECCPVGEAVLNCKEELRTALKTLQGKWEAFDKAKQACEKTAAHIKMQAQQTEKKIKDEFEKLHHFLRVEEAVRVTALKDEEEEKSQVMKAKIEVIGRNMASLSGTIRVIEEKMRVEDISLLHKCRTTMRSSQPTMQDPEMGVVSGVMINVASHVGSLGFRVWEKMKDMVEYTPVTLDPNTAAPWLILSEDLTSVIDSEEKQQLPDNPERFDPDTGVLGAKGFSSGSISWDVEVGDNTAWVLGVAKDSVLRKGKVPSILKNGYLSIYYYHKMYFAGTSPLTRLGLKKKPQRIRVILPSTNTSLPIWEHVRANQVEVMWSVAPYSITVQITPLTSQKAQNKNKLAAKSFFTKSSRDTYICDSFLSGYCQFKFTCELHHTPYPFHWQLRCQDTHHWVNASLSAQVKLEKLYCDIDRETIRLQDMTDVFTLHLDTMKVENSVKYDKARRLTNSSNPGSNPYFPTEWNLYWWNDSSWEKYENEISKDLLGEMEAGKSSLWFYIGKRLYELDFSRLIQMNVTTGFKRRDSSLSKADQPTQVLPSLSVDPLQEFSSWYPPVWTLSPNQDFSLLEVPPSTKVYQSIYSLFHSTMPETKAEIISIQQVQNIFQWDKYQRQKEHMQSRSADQSGSLERHLFHGTTEDSAKEICLNNFDPRVSGKNGVAYGRGSYFAQEASYSIKYAPATGGGGCQHMFLAKVLVGNIVVGNSSYCRPPQLNPLKPGYELYDTCVNQMPKPSIFVVFDSCQCYPYYLIKYKVVPDIVNICE